MIKGLGETPTGRIVNAVRIATALLGLAAIALSIAAAGFSVLRDPGASKTAKSLAGSALAQAGTTKQSSEATATTAAKALNDGRTSASTRTLAGSVLTQKPGE